MTDALKKDLDSFGPAGRKFIEFAAGRMSGQEKAVCRIAKVLDRFYSGLKVDNRPVYTCLLVGGPGSGKTLLANLLADFLFGDPDALTTVSCGNFFQTSLSQWDLNQYDYRRVRSSSKPMEKMLDAHNETANARIDAAQRLGEVKASGADEETVKKLQEEFDALDKKFEESYKIFQPIVNALRSIVVFDHVEEGKPAVQDELARIFEKGLLVRESGGESAIVSFRNAFVFISCNDCVHPEEANKSKSLGFQTVSVSSKDKNDKMYLRSIGEIKNYFSPRLLSHLDRVEILVSYEDRQLRDILEIIIKDFQTELGKKFPIGLMIGDDVKDFIVKESSDHPEHGIRLLRRKFDKYIRDQIAALKNRGKVSEGDSVSAKMYKADGKDIVALSVGSIKK